VMHQSAVLGNAVAIGTLCALTVVSPPSTSQSTYWSELVLWRLRRFHGQCSLYALFLD